MYHCCVFMLYMIVSLLYTSIEITHHYYTRWSYFAYVKVLSLLDSPSSGERTCCYIFHAHHNHITLTKVFFVCIFLSLLARVRKHIPFSNFGGEAYVKVCIAMMLPLICLTGTPSNRTSRARMDRVAGRRVTLDYNGLLICNPDGNPGCNTGGPGRICQRSVRSS